MCCDQVGKVLVSGSCCRNDILNNYLWMCVRCGWIVFVVFYLCRLVSILLVYLVCLVLGLMGFVLRCSYKRLVDVFWEVVFGIVFNEENVNVSLFVCVSILSFDGQLWKFMVN